MINSVVKKFLTARLTGYSRLLLGCSGGPDSMALLGALLDLRDLLGFDLHVAHIDHGWRKESSLEAKILAQLMEGYKVCFFQTQLQEIPSKDCENICRNQRMAFFQRLHQNNQYQALLLGHHMNDHAETVLKRIGEGAGLRALGGIYPDACFGDLKIWRPLLSLKKKDIIKSLDDSNIKYFIDSTNQDFRYLRSRMRHKMFPTLEKYFGKNIENNFSRFGVMCQELSEYLDHRCRFIAQRSKQSFLGTYLLLTEDIHHLELKYFLKQQADISYDALKQLLELIEDRKISKYIDVGNRRFHLFYPHLFIYERPFADFFSNNHLWNNNNGVGWESFWNGSFTCPEGAHYVRLIDLDMRIQKKLKKWYASHRVPAFFYEKGPVFVKDHMLVGEALTGKQGVGAMNISL